MPNERRNAHNAKQSIAATNEGRKKKQKQTKQKKKKSTSKERADRPSMGRIRQPACLLAASKSGARSAGGRRELRSF